MRAVHIRCKGMAVGWVRTEVDGVPTFWSEFDGDLRAGLVFRVGMADERLSRRGITHLVEHLALHGLSQQDYHANGEVDAITTTFFTHGTEQSVREFLESVCRALSYLPTDRMAVENQILRTEAAGRREGPIGPLALWRYGAATYGLAGYEECAVGHHTGDEVRSWAWQRFNRGNAVLWLVGGPVPAGLTLPLPEGQRIPVPVPTSALPRTPAYFQGNIDGVAMSAVVDRSIAATGYAHLLGTRLRQVLRHDGGISYSPVTDYEPRDGQSAHVVAFADCLPEARSTLVSEFVAQVDSLADTGVPAAECAQVVDAMRDQARAPGAAAGLTLAAARAELLGAEPLRLESFLAEVATLDPESLTAAARQARDSTLLMLPDGQVPPGRRYAPAPTRSAMTVEGRILLARRTPASKARRTIRSGKEGRARLVIGPEGISRVDGPVFVTVRFAECQVMLAWPDGARHLVGLDGFTLRIEPNLWEGGEVLPELIDRGVDPGVVIRLPARPAEEIPPPVTSRWGGLRDRLTRS